MPQEQWKSYKVNCLRIAVWGDVRSVRIYSNDFSIFKSQHGKTYNDDEDAKRFEIFKDNLKMIAEHNAKYEKGEVTYTMGINQFADMLPEERKNMCGLLPDPTKK